MASHNHKSKLKRRGVVDKCIQTWRAPADEFWTTWNSPLQFWRQNKYLCSRALTGFDFRTKPRHRLTMQQGVWGQTEMLGNTEGPWGRQGAWGTGAKGLKECLWRHQL